jgi:hypothetical protein
VRACCSGAGHLRSAAGTASTPRCLAKKDRAAWQEIRKAR